MPRGVGATAIGVAALRAAERHQPRPLFTDPFAQRFVDAAPGALDELVGSQRPDVDHEAAAEHIRRLLTYVAVRTRFFDDCLHAAAQAGIRQIVLLAAGLDTRAYRMRWPEGTRVFEVDLPRMLEFKHRVLDGDGAVPTCARVPVAADLTENWTDPLRGAGFRADEPTAWLLEGILVYLTDEQVDTLLRELTAWSVPESRMALGYRDRPEADTDDADGLGGAGASVVRSLWRSRLREDPRDWLARYGWDANPWRVPDLTERYGRAAVDPDGSWLIDAHR